MNTYGQNPETMMIFNPRWEQFAQRVANGGSGGSAAAAYRAAYGVKGASAETAASRLFRRVEVSSRVAELRKQAAGASAIEEARTSAKAAYKVVLALAKKRELLHAFAATRKHDVKDRMRAIELDAKLAGELKGDAVTVNATAVSGSADRGRTRRADRDETGGDGAQPGQIGGGANVGRDELKHGRNP